ncbi:MAG: extracellular solute-binding protein [Ruminococcaceae bacterium]|nr:extracellular solute-binding protein [Oscillospiraceae bacterium]
MRKIMKRVLVIALMAVLLMGCFAGCGTDERPEVTLATKNADGLYTTDPVTLNIIVKRHPDREEYPDYIWYFEYIEYWFGQQGYDVTINVEEVNSDSQVDLMLNTDTLPDIVWAITLNNTEIVRYGVEEHMLLDWTPYLTEELMPNLCAQYEKNPSMKAAETAPDGGIYGLPYITPYPYSTIPGMVNRMFVRQSWLDEVGLEMPTTEQEFLDMLRAFKTVKREGLRTDPLVSSYNFFEKYLWTCLGFYGTDGTAYGTEFMIKDGEVVLPAYTEEYKHFVELMHTMYSEGLLPNDYLTMGNEKAVARINEGSSGVHGWYTLQYVGDDYADQKLLGPIPMGGNDDVYVSRLSDYTLNTVWVSSKTKHPEVVALMMDFMYSEEGSWLYMFGPKKGEDPLGLVDGWYYDDNGLITTSKVASGKYSLMEVYARDHIRPNDYAGLRVDPVTTGDGSIITYIDAVTGGEFKVINDRVMTRSSNDEWWRLETIDTWSDYATSIRLPAPYLDVDTMTEMNDIASAVKQWINQETPKFIQGTRPLSELDKFMQELKGFGVEEYIETYREAYKSFMESTFGE